MPRRVSAYSLGQEHLVFVISDNGRGLSYTVADIRRAYLECCDHEVLATRYRISPRILRKVLDLAGVIYFRELFQRYQCGEKLSDIATSIRMHASSLAKLFKANEHKIQRGPRRPPLNQRQISEAILERQTINTAARNLHVHWATAKKLLVEFGFLSQENAGEGAPYALAASFHNTS